MDDSIRRGGRQIRELFRSLFFWLLNRSAQNRFANFSFSPPEILFTSLSSANFDIPQFYCSTPFEARGVQGRTAAPSPSRFSTTTRVPRATLATGACVASEPCTPPSCCAPHEIPLDRWEWKPILCRPHAPIRTQTFPL